MGGVHRKEKRSEENHDWEEAEKLWPKGVNTCLLHKTSEDQFEPMCTVSPAAAAQNCPGHCQRTKVTVFLSNSSNVFSKLGSGLDLAHGPQLAVLWYRL